MFITINGVLINVHEVQTARTVTENDVNGTAGCKVWFIHDGWVVIPDITVEQLEEALSRALTAAAPF
jgi:hypothetical protein